MPIRSRLLVLLGLQAVVAWRAGRSIRTTGRGAACAAWVGGARAAEDRRPPCRHRGWPGATCVLRRDPAPAHLRRSVGGWLPGTGRAARGGRARSRSRPAPRPAPARGRAAGRRQPRVRCAAAADRNAPVRARRSRGGPLRGVGAGHAAPARRGADAHLRADTRATRSAHRPAAAPAQPRRLVAAAIALGALGALAIALTLLPRDPTLPLLLLPLLGMPAPARAARRTVGSTTRRARARPAWSIVRRLGTSAAPHDGRPGRRRPVRAARARSADRRSGASAA